MARPRKQDQIRDIDSMALCADQVVHIDAVRSIAAGLPDRQTISDISALFTVLGDPTRLRIVAALALRELCVCDLAASLGLSQSATSHQLRILRQHGLVRSRREGRLTYYALDDEHVSALFAQALDHVHHRTKDDA